MASIVQRKNSYCVVYMYTDEHGKRKQKWETYKTLVDATARRKEIEYKESQGIFVVPNCKTLDDLLREFVDLYGKDKWALSTYDSNVSLIRHYISPVIGSFRLQDINTRVIENYYNKLLKMERASDAGKKLGERKTVTNHIVRDIHKLLRTCFEQAVRWDIMEKNPCQYATIPKADYKKREIWTAETLFHAIEVCEDDRLKLALNLAFSCSLRIGELLGLTWDCVDISPESISAGTAHVRVAKELQRVTRSTMKELSNKDIVKTFPSVNTKTKTVLVLKSPKTLSSMRKVFIPKTVAEMMIEWKNKQEQVKEMLGSEYKDFDLVFAGPMGMPTESSTITGAFEKLIKEHPELPKVVFHSLRHSSITYKLKLNGGDIKAVQGDSGHSQVKMVTDVYSHILDDDRKHNAELFEEAFYSEKKKEPDRSGDEDVDPETLLKLLKNPELAAVIKALAKNI